MTASAAVVLVHGNAASADVWRRVHLLLPRPAAAIHLPGFGTARTDPLFDGGAGDGDAKTAFVRHVVAVADICTQQSGDALVLAGSGIGCALVGLAARHLGARVRGVVMSGPVGVAGGHAEFGSLAGTQLGSAFLRLAGRTFGRGKFLRDQLADPGADPEACGILLDALRRARGFHRLARLNRPESLAGLRELRCPVAVLWGDRDGVLPVACAPEFMAHLPRHATLQVVPGAGHALPLERPDAVAAAIRRLAALPESLGERTARG